MAENKKKRSVDHTENYKPKKTFSYFDSKPEENIKPKESKVDIPSVMDTNWRKANGTKSSSARIWVDTLNRVNALITMQHFDSFNDFVLSMLDEYEENLSENDYKYQELIVQMYNSKKKNDS